MKRMNHHLTERQVRLLRMYSIQTGLSVAEIIRRFVDDGLRTTHADHLEYEEDLGMIWVWNPIEQRYQKQREEKWDSKS